MSTKNSNVTIWNRTHDLPACSALPQPTAPPRAPEVDGWSGGLITVWARFSAPVQSGPGAHPDSYKMGTVTFLEVKRPGRGVDHPLLTNAEI